jgi:hypothetical protein
MTKLLEEAIAKARDLAPADQDLAAEALLSVIYRNAPDCQLTPDQVAEVKRIQKEIREGTAKFATDEEMAALWKKCGL